MSRIRSYTATLVLAGTAAGTALYGSVSGDDGGGVPVNGQLLAVQVQFGAGTMVGGTCQIQTLGQAGPAETLLNYVGGTSQWFYPRAQSMGTNGVVLASQYDRMPVDDRVSMIVSGGTIGTVTSRALFWTDR